MQSAVLSPFITICHHSHYCSLVFFLWGFIRMITKVALVPPVAASQTAPRLWPSPVASSKLPPVIQTCLQVSDGPWPSEGVLSLLEGGSLKYVSTDDSVWLALTFFLNRLTNKLISVYKDKTRFVQFKKPLSNCSCMAQSQPT